MTIEYTTIFDSFTIFLKNVKINLNYAWEIERGSLAKVIILEEEEVRTKNKSITIDSDSLIMSFAWYNKFPRKAFTNGDVCLDKVGIIFQDNDLETFKKSPLKALSTCRMFPYLKRSPVDYELKRVQVVDDTGGILSKFSGIVFSSNKLIDYEC